MYVRKFPALDMLPTALPPLRLSSLIMRAEFFHIPSSATMTQYQENALTDGTVPEYVQYVDQHEGRPTNQG